MAETFAHDRGLQRQGMSGSKYGPLSIPPVQNGGLQGSLLPFGTRRWIMALVTPRKETPIHSYSVVGECFDGWTTPDSAGKAQIVGEYGRFEVLDTTEEDKQPD